METEFKNVLDTILFKLRDKYPRYDIQFVQIKANRSKLVVNGNILHTFDPILLEKEVEFLKDHENYIDFVVSVFDEPLSVYHKKESKTVKKGRGSRGLTLQQIKEAMANSKSNRGAARYLNVHYSTFKKYAKMYFDEDGISLFDKHLNERGKGISKGYGANSGGMKLEDIFAGKYPNYPAHRYKHRLVRIGYLKEECAICGFSERRLQDYKVPLLLDYIDGNPQNKALENVRLLCYNCYYLNVGDLFWRKKGEFAPTKRKNPNQNLK